MKKIIIIGSAGAGKTTLAAKLGVKLSIPVHHLDKHYWRENWSCVSQDEFKAIQRKLMTEPEWVIDGNFTQTMDQRMAAADTIIFLDFPKRIILWRYFKRYFQNFNKVRPDVGGNNKQNMAWKHLKYVLTYPRHEIYDSLKTYAQGKNVLVFKHPREVDVFLS